MSGGAFTLLQDGDFLVLRFDLPGEKVNLLRGDTLDELDLQLDEIARRPARALFIESGKANGFIAGADVRVIAALPDTAAAVAAAQRGQGIFAELARLSFPTVALIHGACVGGGLELALACTARVASLDPATRLGLPEVMLGILPGFGGTQRLPRTIGLLAALPLLLTGRLVSAKEARRIGLVDELAARERLRVAAASVVKGIVERRLGTRPAPLAARLAEKVIASVAPLRRKILARAAAQVRAKAGDLYPAPFALLEAVAAGYDPGGATGYAVEARKLSELLVSDVARNLVRLFLLTEEARGEGEEAATGERAFIAGAGQMGSAIASLFVGAGMRVRLSDPSPEALARGTGRVRELLQKRFKEERQRAATAFDRLEPTLTRHGLERCDLFLEAAVEKLDVKQQLLAEVEPQLRTDALVATNTSSLDLDRLADVLTRKDRFVGLHFFHPAERMRLVEVVRGSFSGDVAVAQACALARRLGKVPVIVGNRPGFLVNRVLAPYLIEAERLVLEGAPIEALDRALRAAGMAMGPIELLDEVGLDVATLVGDVLRKAFPGRFDDVGLVRRLQSTGALGRKSGRGFYLHGKQRRPNPELPPARAATAEEVAAWRDRLLLLVVAEAFRCLEEGVVRREEEIDLAMVLGTGFLIPQGGPMRWARKLGLPTVARRLAELTSLHGARFEPPATLARA